MKNFVFFTIAGMLSFSTVYGQEAPGSADEILNQAFKVAAVQKKNVFVIFHASWCGWCHQLDSAMNDPACKQLFTDQYVIRHLTVFESKTKKSSENPGALELLKKYNGDNQGIPYWLVFDSQGRRLADSQRRAEGAGLNTAGTNTGCPATKEEIEHFRKVLSKTSSLKQDQLDTIEKVFTNR